MRRLSRAARADITPPAHSRDWRTELDAAAARVRDLGEQARMLADLLGGDARPEVEPLTCAIERLSVLAHSAVRDIDQSLAAASRARDPSTAAAWHTRARDGAARINRLLRAATTAYSVACHAPSEASPRLT
jgi:hypothetical protein